MTCPVCISGGMAVVDAHPVCSECGRELIPNGKEIDRYIRDNFMHDSHWYTWNKQKLYNKVAELVIKVNELEKNLAEHSHPVKFPGSFKGG